MEREFDSRALLVRTYDFVTCQRADGSYYGNGGSQCKKGSESSLPQTEAAKRLSPELSATFDKYAEGIQKMNSKQSIEELKGTTQLLVEKTAEIRDKMEKGDLTFEEYEDFLVNGHNSIDGAKFVIRGMEPGGSSDTDSGRLDLLAQDMSVSKIERDMKTDVRVTELVKMAADPQISSNPSMQGFTRSALTDEVGASAKGWGIGGSFANKVSPLIVEADPSLGNLTSPATKYMATSAKTVDYLPMRGVRISDNRMYDTLAKTQKDPRFKEISSRQDVIDKYGSRRDQKFLNDMTSAAKNDPQFRGGFAAPGGGKSKADAEKWNNYKILAEQHQAQGGKVYSYTYNGSKSKTSPNTNKGAQGVEVLVYDLGKGKNFVAARTSVNNQSWKKDSMKDIFVTSETLAKKGKLSEWSGKADSVSKSKPKPKTTTTRAKKAKVEEPAPKKASGGMSTWSKSKLERARKRAYDQGNDAQVAKINAILGGMS